MAKRTLVGGVGYRHLTDMSVGMLVMDELMTESWPQHVMVEDISVGPIAVVHWLSQVDPPFERVVVLTAADRGGTPGSLRCYRWDRVLPSPDEVQERVSEAVTGVVDADNLLVVTRQFGVLPEEVFVIEVEPVVPAFGLEPTPSVRALMPEMKRLARRLADPDRAELSYETMGLGGIAGSIEMNVD